MSLVMIIPLIIADGHPSDKRPAGVSPLFFTLFIINLRLEKSFLKLYDSIIIQFLIINIRSYHIAGGFSHG